jgi:hypothetical protein
MQTVEQGLIGLDDDLSDLLPDLGKLEVLDGTVDEQGIPKTKKRKNKITLRYVHRHLLAQGSDGREKFTPVALKRRGIRNLPSLAGPIL